MLEGTWLGHIEATRRIGKASSARHVRLALYTAGVAEPRGIGFLFAGTVVQEGRNDRGWTDEEFSLS
jgi:hypothetical protein